MALVPYAAPSTRTSTLHLDHEGHRIRNRRPPSSHMSPPATCQRIHSPWRCGCGRVMQVDCFSTFPPPLRVRCCCAESGQSAQVQGLAASSPHPHRITSRSQGPSRTSSSTPSRTASSLPEKGLPLAIGAAPFQSRPLSAARRVRRSAGGRVGELRPFSRTLGGASGAVG